MFFAEVSNMCILHDYVLLMGDFNARTGNKPDFIDADEYLASVLDFDEDMSYVYLFQCII